MIGALLFPVGFVMIILLGLELVTGSFALIPLAVLEKKTSPGRMLNNFFWVIIGHLIGCAVYAALYGLTITKMGTDMSNPLIQTLITTSEGKTTAYKSMGAEGMTLALIKAMLCNWMVTLGAVMAMTSKSTAGKILAMWLPILTFFGQGFEHTVVNMFVIPAGMLLGAKVSFGDWWLWNGIPVLLGNFLGGVLFTGLLFYLSQKALSPELLPQRSSRPDGEMLLSQARQHWRKAYETGKHKYCWSRTGDPELITVKALRRIQTADVILYDRLVNEELLAYGRKEALRIYCGKAPGQHSMPHKALKG